MTTSVTISVHCEEDANFTYHEHNGLTWVTLESSDGLPVAMFGSPELLRRLFGEALAALPEPEPVSAARPVCADHPGKAATHSVRPAGMGAAQRGLYLCDECVERWQRVVGGGGPVPIPLHAATAHDPAVVREAIQVVSP